jgi:hypothetical protein
MQKNIERLRGHKLFFKIMESELETANKKTKKKKKNIKYAGIIQYLYLIQIPRTGLLHREQHICASYIVQPTSDTNIENKK